MRLMGSAPPRLVQAEKSGASSTDAVIAIENNCDRVQGLGFRVQGSGCEV